MKMMQTKTAINASRAMQNNLIWPTFPFKSNTMKHVFLIIQFPESFNLEKSYLIDNTDQSKDLVGNYIIS